MINENEFGKNLLLVPKGVVNADNSYLKIETNTEDISIPWSVKNQSKEELLYSCEDDLIRFIDIELEEWYSECGMVSSYFLPDHIYDRLLDFIGDLENQEELNRLSKDKIPEDLYPYLPSYIGTSEYIKTTNRETILAKDRQSYCTSFFKCVNNEEVIETIKALQKSIPVLRNDKSFSIGSIHKLGLLESSRRNKTNDPDSIHFSFFKYKDIGSFAEIAKNFSKVD